MPKASRKNRTFIFGDQADVFQYLNAVLAPTLSLNLLNYGDNSQNMKNDYFLIGFLGVKGIFCNVGGLAIVLKTRFGFGFFFIIKNY